MMFRVIKIRLYPNKVQELKLNKVLGCYRFVYNQTLARKQQEYLVDKAFNNGKQVIFVDRFYPSSKTCSVCGYKKHDLKLSDREWICPQCGEHHDRDINAAMNILLEGERIIGVRSTEYTLMENPTVDDRGNAS